MLNSPLREEALNQRAALIPQKPEFSILDWWQFSDRFLVCSTHEPTFLGEKEKYPIYWMENTDLALLRMMKGISA